MIGSSIREFSDPDEYQSAIRGAHVEIAVKARGQFVSKLTRVDLLRVWMQRGQESLPRVTHAAIPESRSPIFFLTDTEQRALTHSGLELTPGQIMIFGYGASHYHRSSSACRWGSMSLSPTDLADAGLTLASRPLSAPPSGYAIKPSPGLMSRLQTLHRGVAQLAATAPSVLENPEIARALEHALVHAMVCCLTEEDAPPTAIPRFRSMVIMRRFEEVLAANLDQPLHLMDICAATGASEYVLRRCCHDHLGMGPVRYLWLRRMHLARRKLRQGTAGATSVTTVATDCGFWELGRFSVQYRQLFGESPSTTLRLARGEPPVEHFSPVGMPKFESA